MKRRKFIHQTYKGPKLIFEDMGEKPETGSSVTAPDNTVWKVHGILEYPELLEITVAPYFFVRNTNRQVSTDGSN